MDELTRKLAELQRKAIAQSRQAQDRRASDWQRLQADHPDHARFIAGISQAFGKPAMVRVTHEDGTVMLDTESYR